MIKPIEPTKSIESIEPIKSIIVKSNRLTIEVKAEKWDDLLISKYTEVEINKLDQGKSEKYIDEAGKAKKVGEDKAGEKSITEIAQREKRNFYKQLLQNQYKEIENIVFLSGAGTSVDIGKTNKGMTMSQLWDTLERDNLDCLTTLIKETNYHPITTESEILKEGLIKDLEALLSKAEMKKMVTFKPKEKNDGDKNEESDLEKAIKTVREFIVEKCSLELPENAPHIQFLNKVSLRPQKLPRVKIFTLNYDTLFEAAAAKEKFTIIDGFTFSNPRVFNGKYFDYDIIETCHNRQDKKESTIAKLIYLFKMHGSLNWKNVNNETIQVDGDIKVEDRAMIFPQDSKYEHSYEQPYFEMMARFQQSLRIENTLLITSGFSFQDKHISSVILESIKQNPSLNLMAFTYPEIVDGSANAKQYQKELDRITKYDSRVTLIAEKFKDFAENYPSNKAHSRYDMLEALNENLKQILPDDGK